MISKRKEGRLYAVTGASRSGKTWWTAQQVAGARRLLVWDYPKGEWALRYKCQRISTAQELQAVCVPGAKPGRFAFMRVTESPATDFELFCRMAWVYARAHGAPIIAEETATVTSAAKAPPAWGNLCRMALGYGSDLYAVTQRPAESDKTAFGNASVVHAGRASTPRDRQTVAEYLDVPVQEVAALLPLHYIERDLTTGELRRGITRNKRT